MVRYIKGKDGKMAGSIGDGKHNVPTAATNDLPSRVAQMPAEPVTDMSRAYQAFQAAKAAHAAERGRAGMAAYHAALAAQPAQPAPSDPYARDMTVPLTVTDRGDDEFEVSAPDETGSYGWAGRQTSDGSWSASVHGGYDDYLDDDELVSASFDTREEAEAWTRAEFGQRVNETADFDRRWATDRDAMKAEWDVAIRDADNLWEENLVTKFGKTRTGEMSGVSRWSTISFLDTDSYVAEVRSIDDEDLLLHRRHCTTFEQAHAFAKDMTLRTGWELNFDE